MLQINKDETKSWYLTLTEKTTIANPTYLFSLTHRLTTTITNVIILDVSTYKERYNQFDIIEGTTFDLLTGEYMYKVYAQTSVSNTDPNLSGELVEEGILKVNPQSLLDIYYDSTLITKQYNVPEDGIFDWKTLFYNYFKRVEIAEGLQCLQDKLYNLAKQI